MREAAVVEKIDDERLKLTPGAKLAFHGSCKDWQKRPIELGSSEVRTKSPAAAFWRKFAASFLTYSRHNEIAQSELPPMITLKTLFPANGDQDFAPALAEAPPMQGGEYLCEEALSSIWKRLKAWTLLRVRECG